MTTPHYLEDELKGLIRSGHQVFEFIDNASLDGMWFWDLENPEHEWMSDRFWEVLGVDPATKQHRASEWQDLIFQEDLPQCIANFEAHCANPDHPYDQIVRYRHADGSTVWVRCRGLAIRDENGKCTRMFGAHNEITDLVETREKLARDYSTIVEKAAIGIAHVAQDGRFVSVNERLCEIVGLPANELMQRSFQDITHPDDLNADLDQVRALLAGERDRYSMEKRYFHSSGRAVWIDLTVAIVRHANPEADYFISAIQDISDRKAAEIELEQANRMLKQFAYTTSHDLRAPLRGLNHLAGWIRDDLVKSGVEVPDSVSEHLTLISERTDHLQELLDGLLQFASVGFSAEPPVAVDSSRILEEIGKLVLPPSYSLELGDDLPELQTNEAQFRQVFMNLIGNAAEHHDRESGTIRVTCHEHRDQRSFDFHVSDDGPGIPRGFHEQIFELFRTGSETSAKRAGGLGLAIVNSHLSLIGGSIRVNSDPSARRGTEFIVSWPAVSATP